MSKVLVTESSLQAIAAAIRQKLGVATAYKPGDMAAAVASIHGEPVLETLTATENGTYAPSSGKDGFSSVTVSLPVSGTTVYAGTAAPTAAQGSNGDLYLQYTAVTSFQLPAAAPFAFLYKLGSTPYYASSGENAAVHVFVTGTKDVYFVSAAATRFQMSNSSGGSGSWYAPGSSGFTSVDSTTGLYYWLRNDMTAGTINETIPRCASFADGMAAILAAVNGTAQARWVIGSAYLKTGGAWTALTGADAAAVTGVITET